VHGFPKVMGVLTHLDGFRDAKRLKKTKKALKHRFWAEIYQGAAGAAPLDYWLACAIGQPPLCDWAASPSVRGGLLASGARADRRRAGAACSCMLAGRARRARRAAGRMRAAAGDAGGRARARPQAPSCST